MKKLLLGLLTLSLFVTPALAQTDVTYELPNYDYEYDWDYQYGDLEYQELTDDQAVAIMSGIVAFMLVFLPIVSIVGLGSYIYFGFAFMTIGKKLKYDKPWLAWIPLANIYMYAKLAGFSGWTALLFFVPFVNFIYMIVIMMKIAERRGFESWLGLLILVPIANFVLPGYLAWAEPSKKAE